MNMDDHKQTRDTLLAEAAERVERAVPGMHGKVSFHLKAGTCCQSTVEESVRLERRRAQ